MTSFNAFGSSAKSYDRPHKPVWLGTVAPHAVGGVLASSACKAGALYPAGTPINFDAGVITPLVAFKVAAFAAAAGSETADTITIYPAVYGDLNLLPAVDDMIQKAGATFATAAKAAKVTGVTALTGADAGKYAVTVAHSATIDSVTAGDYIVFSASATAGSNKAMAAQPNAYLYNDIYLGNLDSPKATGAAVDFHGEGIMIDFTPALPFADAMKAAVPNVIQVKFPEGAFVTID